MNAPHHHHHQFAHDHAHGHAHAGESRLLFAFALTLITLIAEGVGGWYAGSLALLADAGHMLVDAFALLLAWAGAHFAQRPADDRRSFGYARLEVLAGYTNSLTQIGIGVWIIVEAALRLSDPQPIKAGVMLVIALIGFGVNAVLLRLLGGHHADDLNAAGARLHVLGDLLGSLGAVVAALVIRSLNWLPADPLISMLVALLIVGSAWNLLRRSAHILLEGTPEGVDTAGVAAAARLGVGVRDVHHVHVWQLAGGRRLATLHVHLADGADAQRSLVSVQSILREQFHIAHATVQIEPADSERAGCMHGDCTAHRH
ncbi:MAG: cation transporter [Gammaproteobacteria bacterium]|nr:MAG: cation transporter [Gammaproteobacteria bacterium]